MRRGHPGIGVGWRGDSPRHFRPRGGGHTHFRGPRPYGRIESPRFPPPGPRFQGSRYSTPSSEPELHDRSYRGSRHSLHRPDRNQFSQGPRKIFPLLQRIRQQDQDTYDQSTSYYESNQNPTRVNNISDANHRTPIKPPPYPQTPWVTYSEDRSPVKGGHRNQDDHAKKSHADGPSSGHRPLASDIYGASHGSTMDNSNTFSRSVDDTVSIVRKRLQRRESQHSSEPLPNPSDIEKSREHISAPYPDIQQELPMKRKPIIHPHKNKNIKLNCDKIKNKIVHQLFMMDKDKIHKLMDNPNSSSKFEYAISSLVTESQNSYNLHLRSTAEKSLRSTSTEFLQDDTNTIYEDTFMKQMQCILEPQDTVLLEDIKPIVLAELCKVLQLDDQKQDDEPTCSRDNPSQYSSDTFHYDNYQKFDMAFSPQQENSYYKQPNPYPRSPTPTFEDNADFGSATEIRKPLYERRKSRRSKDHNDDNRKNSSEHRKKERSIESQPVDSYRRLRTPPLLFANPVNPEHLSEEDDPFAELDKQYHVAVDPSFIESYDLTSPPSPVNTSHSPIIKKETLSKLHTPETPLSIFASSKGDKSPDLSELHKIKEELHSELQGIAKEELALKFSSPSNTKPKRESETSTKHHELKQELLNNNLFVANTSSVIPVKQTDSAENKTSDCAFGEDKNPEPKAVESFVDKSESAGTMIKSSTPSRSRKRSIDQRPSHRKEKRKKNESSPSDTNKQILNKNIIINVNDCTKSSEKCDAPKSVFNLFFSKEKSNKDSSKDSKKLDVGHLEKYIKRKDEKGSRRSKEKEKEKDDKYDKGEKKKHDSSSSNHSIMSPTETSNSLQTPTKNDVQIKLKPIDMFGEQTRKASVHQAHRNTAPTPTLPTKTLVETKPIVISRKLTKRHNSTQVVIKSVPKETQTTVTKSSSTRFSQTERKKLITRGAQTDPVSFKPNIKSTDAFERMKEIDMEIQALLQEKFKLYNSLESKESCSNTMPTLGMAVLNVAPELDPEPVPINEPSISEDIIIDDFASMKELEDIALEVFQEVQSEILQEEKTEPEPEQNITAVPKEKKKSVSKEKTETNQKDKIEKKIDEEKLVPAKRSRRLVSKVVEVERKSSESPTPRSSRSKRSMKPPNISLIEQIITDDRPLEEIISLEELEKSPSKTEKLNKSNKSQKPKKKSNKKVKTKSDDIFTKYDIKDCSIVLLRQDLDRIVRRLKKAKTKSKAVPALIEQEPVREAVEPSAIQITTDAPEPALEETDVNDIQIDMLDVSEDIVIGDLCEVKFSEEKDINNHICEEIILDNSQSSTDEVVVVNTEDHEECKSYDYSADENLRRDCSIVTGNGDAVLAIECIDDQFLAACLDGNVYHFGSDGQLINTLRGSNLAVTCLTIVKEKYGTTVYTGSLDSRIRYYDLETGLEKGPECNVLSPIQTMDRAWETVFVGTRTGFVLQFECKNNLLIPVSTIKFSEQCILALRAMKEGPRKVLLVAARSEAVTIKDAQTGLLLRTLEGPKMTVYTLLFEDGKVYCGTSGHQIHVFDYASGSHMYSHESGKGVVCLRALGGLLLAGCYDGCVYVYRDGSARALAQLRGPSLMLLSLAVLGTKIIAGYKDRSLYIWKIPLGIIKEMIL